MRMAINLEKLPPNDLDAERATLGSLFLEEAALGEVRIFLKPRHFYSSSHSTIYKQMLELADAQEPIDSITIGDALKRKNLLDGVGGDAYLASLFSAVPTWINVEHYARIVHRLGKYRQLIDAAGKIGGIGYSAPTDMLDALNRAGSLLRSITDDEGSTSGEWIGELFNDEFYERLRRGRDNRADLVYWGIENLDGLFGPLAPGDLTYVGARPNIGKTALLLTLAVNVAKTKIPVAFYSFEMDKVSLQARLLQIASGIPNALIRQALLNEKQADYIEEEAAPMIGPLSIFIDDQPPEDIDSFSWKVNADCMRYGFKIVIIDYLQQMNKHGLVKPYEIVTACSKEMKRIARRTGAHLVVATQLSRANENEAREPQLSDMRECLAAGTPCIASDGQLIPIEQLKPDTSLVSLGRGFALSHGVVKDVWATGKRECSRITTETGRVIVATKQHRLLMHEKGSIQRGWWEVERLQVGWKLATARRYPWQGDDTINEAQAELLGWLLGNAHIGLYDAEGTAGSLEDAQYFKALADAEFGLNCRITPYTDAHAWRVHCSSGLGRASGGRPNALKRWLRALGVAGVNSANKTVPDAILSASPNVAARFLRGLMHADGSVKKGYTKAGIYDHHVGVRFTSISEKLARGAQHLLTKLGIVSRLRTERMSGGAIASTVEYGWILQIGEYIEVTKFAELVGFVGDKNARLKAAIAKARARPNSPRLTGDVMWEKVLSIEPAGELETYDVQMVGSPYFVASGILSHNSGQQEQDADEVLLLHRDRLNKDVMRRERTAVILAKMRHSPVGRINLRFNMAYQRFENIDGDSGAD